MTPTTPTPTAPPAPTLHAYVALEQDEDGYPPFDTEELEVEMRHDGACTVLGVPVFTSGIAVDDIVSVVQVEDDDRWWVTGVLIASGRGTARVAPLGATAEEVVAEFAGFGCPATATEHGLVTADLPADVDAAALLALLEAGSGSGRWRFDLGVEPG